MGQQQKRDDRESNRTRQKNKRGPCITHETFLIIILLNTTPSPKCYHRKTTIKQAQNIARLSVNIHNLYTMLSINTQVIICINHFLPCHLQPMLRHCKSAVVKFNKQFTALLFCGQINYKVNTTTLPVKRHLAENNIKFICK